MLGCNQLLKSFAPVLGKGKSTFAPVFVQGKASYLTYRMDETYVKEILDKNHIVDKYSRAMIYAPVDQSTMYLLRHVKSVEKRYEQEQDHVMKLMLSRYRALVKDAKERSQREAV